MKHFPLLILLSSLLSACAVGPLVSHESARTVGEGKTELIGSYGAPGFAIKANHGMSENLDLGFQLETLSMGFRAKYALLNSSQGLSLAGALGYGWSYGGNYISSDLTTSYLSNSWEPYGTLRISHVTLNETRVTDANSNEEIFTITEGSFSYGQFIFGTRYWLDTHWMVSAEISKPFSTSSGVDINGAFFSLGVGYRN